MFHLTKKNNMPKNLTGKQAGTVRQDSVNDPSIRVMRGKNLFPQSFRHPSTSRYGEVDPICAMRAERGDSFPYKFETDLNTYTLASPIKSHVNMYTAAFKVPMKAIYPRNWDIMLPIPNKGNDVPVNTRAIFHVGPFVEQIELLLGSLIRSTSYDSFVRLHLLLEKIFSAGGLFAKFNMHLNAFKVRTPNGVMSFDKYLDTEFFPELRSLLVRLPDGDPGRVSLQPVDPSSGLPYVQVVEDDDERINTYVGSNICVPFRRSLELLRNGSYFISNHPDFDEVVSGTFEGFSFEDRVTLSLNIEPILAYQLTCAHFFSNPKVDFVYSAELFRDNLQSIAYGDSVILPTFVWNGIVKLYDVMSEQTFNTMTSRFSDVSWFSAHGENTSYFPVLGFWYNLFTIQNSLRYGDYFTAAHPEPLAVGDINAPVIDGSVNALDMTRKLQLTRLLNKVNISGPRIDDYLLALFGGPMPEAPDDVPIRLSLEKSNIEGFEVNNTGSEQSSGDARNITTTNLRLTDSRYMFEAAIDKPCWLIVVQYYDAERIYSKTLDRFAYHQDRYDDFIPDLQFEGDQDVKLQELDITRPDVPFAYNLRYMEYKNRYSYASGGFVEFLPSWAFITDNKDGSAPTEHISPDYIRSSPSEFDRFYKSFAGAYSLGSYFHFISFNTNVVNPQRQMVLAPEILA